MNDAQKQALCKEFIKWTGGFAPCEAWVEAVKFVDDECWVTPGLDQDEVWAFLQEWYDRGVELGGRTTIWDPVRCSFTASPW